MCARRGGTEAKRPTELATHDVELVLALEGGRDVVGLGGADSETELVVRHERHPLLVEHVLTRHVGRHVSSDRVSEVLGSVGVELSSVITVGDVDLGAVEESLNLDVEGGLDEVGGLDGSVRDQSGVVSGLGAVGNDDRLDVSDQRVRSWRGR